MDEKKDENWIFFSIPLIWQLAVLNSIKFVLMAIDCLEGELIWAVQKNYLQFEDTSVQNVIRNIKKRSRFISQNYIFLATTFDLFLVLCLI